MERVRGSSAELAQCQPAVGLWCAELAGPGRQVLGGAADLKEILSVKYTRRRAHGPARAQTSAG